MSDHSTKPYLLRAIYEWCTDNGYTPHVAVVVDSRTRVPTEFVKNGEIVLNISFTATSGLKMENDWIHFSARFGGISRNIEIPVDNVIAIYARENGQGMAFEPPGAPLPQQGDDAAAAVPSLSSVPTGDNEDIGGSPPDHEPEPPKKGGRPTLTRVK